MTILVIKGDDETLVAQAVRTAVNELVGNGDRSLMVEETTEDSYLNDDGTSDLTALVNAVQTPPFLTEKRVVVGRHLAQFTKADQVEPLISIIGDPVETTDLVLVWEKGSTATRMGTMPKKLRDVLKSAGIGIDDAAPSGRGRKGLLDRRLATAAVRLDRGAKELIADRLGDDIGRSDSILEILHSTFGEGAQLRADDVAPFLGEASDVPPWDLTDAIDSGKIDVALDKLRRMVQGGGRHSLQIMATLHSHYQRAFALDGAGVADERSAAEHLGLKGSTFPAKKALTLSRKLGTARLAQSISLMAKADLDLRGATAVPPETVMEVLVARLARLNR